MYRSTIIFYVYDRLFFSVTRRILYSSHSRVILIWAIRIVRGRRPRRRCNQYTDAEKRAGVDGFRLIGIIRLGGPILVINVELGGGSSSNARRKRRETLREYFIVYQKKKNKRLFFVATLLVEIINVAIPLKSPWWPIVIKINGLKVTLNYLNITNMFIKFYSNVINLKIIISYGCRKFFRKQKIL